MSVTTRWKGSYSISHASPKVENAEQEKHRISINGLFARTSNKLRYKTDLKASRQIQARRRRGPRVSFSGWLTTPVTNRKFKFLLLGGRPMVGLQSLDLSIGVRVPPPQPQYSKRRVSLPTYCQRYSVTAAFQI